jgi:hypothetical protein
VEVPVTEPVAFGQQFEQLKRRAAEVAGHELGVGDGAPNDRVNGREAGVELHRVYARVGLSKSSRDAWQEPRSPPQQRQQVRTLDSLDDEARATVDCLASVYGGHRGAAAARGCERH